MEREKRYYHFLKQAEALISGTPDLNLTNMVHEYKLPGKTSKAMQEVGILKKNGGGRYSGWEWTGEKPTLEMASKLMERTEGSKYLKFLKDLYWNKGGINDTAEKYIGRRDELSEALRQEKIMSIKGRGPHVVKQWIAPRPDNDMAKRLEERVKKIRRERERKKVGKGKKQKYLNFLQAAKKEIEKGKVNTRDLELKYNVDTFAFKHMRELGIVEKEGLASQTKWKWVAGEPDMKMASELIEASKKANAERKSKAEQGPLDSFHKEWTEAGVLRWLQENVPKQKEQVKVSYIHLLWGLIKIKVTHHNL